MYYFIPSHSESHTNNKVTALQHAEATLVEQLGSCSMLLIETTESTILVSILADVAMDESTHTEGKGNAACRVLSLLLMLLNNYLKEYMWSEIIYTDL